MKKTFCLYLTNNAGFYQDYFEPCCWITKKGNLLDPVQFAEYQKWISGINDWVPECESCLSRELRGVKSPRQRANEDPSLIGIYDESQIGDITRLHLQIDADCNAACLMCSQNNSTTWRKYNIGQIDDKSSANKIIDIKNNAKTKQRFQTVIKNFKLDKLNAISFFGGEPFKNDLHKEFLREVSKYKPLNTVEVLYITNGSLKPDSETIELLRQLKSVFISFSIDGINDHFNYLRWPLQWHQVEENIKYFIDLELPDKALGISSAINPFNIFYYDRYIDWENNFFKDCPYYSRLKFDSAFESTGVINLSCIPEKLVKRLEEKFSSTYPWVLNHILPFDSDKYNSFISYIKFHDTKRNLDYSKIFPEIAEYFPELKSS
jgi:hypothetical protein